MKFIGLILLLIVGAVVSKLVVPKFMNEPDPFPPPPGEEVGSRAHLRTIANHVKKELPKKVNSEVTATDIYARHGEMVYTYKLVNYGARDLNGDKFREYAQTELRKEICKDRDIKRMWKHHDIALSFQFIGNDGFSLGMLSVSRGDC